MAQTTLPYRMGEMSMGPTEALLAIGESVDFEDVGTMWRESMSAFDPKRFDFLQRENIFRSSMFCGIHDSCNQTLVDTARQIESSDSLSRIAWNCKWRLYDNAKPEEIGCWPLFKNSLGENRGIFYLLIGLAMVPYVRDYHRSIGVPENITRETCSQVLSFCRAYQDGHNGELGIQRSRISWLRHYPRNPLFRIHGLEYWLRPNPIPINVYRNIDSRAVVALMWGDEFIAESGYIAAAENEKGAWKTAFHETDEAVIGYPLHPLGYVSAREIELSLNRWRRALSYGDPVLQLHIPYKAQISPHDVKSSLKASFDFFKMLFPRGKPVAFVSSSWAFSPLLESLIGPDSNLVRFQREVYLSSGPPGHGGFSYIFPEDQFVLEKATRETRLQRSIVDLITKGDRWRTGEMFFLTEDIERYGSQHYLREYTGN